jgi:hypothetical protein
VGPGANGRSYAENWRTIASPIVSGDRLDLLAWNRESDRLISRDNPFRTTVSFSPSTVVGDAATPGYLTDIGNEAPNAVPSVYTAKYGHWVLPYTITFYRFASRNRSSDDKYGFLRVRVERGREGPIVLLTGSGRSLRTTQIVGQQTPDFTEAIDKRGRVFIKTPGLTYLVDPQQGRIITAFPPLASSTANSEVPEIINGEPVPTVFRLNTLHPDAGQQLPDGRSYPPNAGITEANLTTRNYFRLTNALNPPVGNLTPGTSGDLSPFAIFGNVLIVPGSERVLGPDNNPARVDDDLLVPYFRIPVSGSVAQQSPVNPDGTYQGDPVGPLGYKLELDVNPIEPKVVFDDSIRSNVPPRGLPAKGPGQPGPEKEVQITYLWQNNYAREVDGQYEGWPVDSDGDTLAENNGRSMRPEADVVKVDYSTRALLNINLGVRVYDASSGRPQVVQLTDKVKINNLGR